MHPFVLKSPNHLHLHLLWAVSLLTALFAWKQNQGSLVGGPISLPKALWLNYALCVFLILPFSLWRNVALSLAVRALFGWVFVSFALRSLVETFMLYFTRKWECIYGIGHDLFTLLLVVWLRYRLPARCSGWDHRALNFATLLQTTLLLESFMAWQFSRFASPTEGVYFAGDTPHFRLINNITWAAVAVVYPFLLNFLWLTRHDFCRP
jgi:hypothetical protein